MMMGQNPGLSMNHGGLDNMSVGSAGMEMPGLPQQFNMQGGDNNMDKHKDKDKDEGEDEDRGFFFSRG
jgi:hypothetical protein